MTDLKTCPFCGCAMSIRSNRDWHHLEGSHSQFCVFEQDEPVLTVPASPEQLEWLIETWNTRHGA